MSAHRWICSRCAARSIPIEQVLGVRTRFANEKCPLCVNPGAGMEYVSVPQDTHNTSAAQGAAA